MIERPNIEMLIDPWNELGSWDDTSDWWVEQDADLEWIEAQLTDDEKVQEDIALNQGMTLADLSDMLND